MKKFRTALPCSLFILLFSSCGHTCNDRNSREFTSDEINFIGAVSGLSYQYIDRNTHALYYLKCFAKGVSLRDTTSNGSSAECDDRYQMDVYDHSFAGFTANIPLYGSYKNKIEIEMRTFDTDNSSFEIYIYSDYRDNSSGYTTQSDTYDLDYNPKTKRLVPHSNPAVNYLDSVVINGKVYKGVFVIISESQRYYDTIYYSPDGILKFISSGNNINLELVN
jgi:hypothetical protein